MTEEIKKIMHLIRSRYQSLDAPDFSFGGNTLEKVKVTGMAIRGSKGYSLA
jgi:hypothetical protein